MNQPTLETPIRHDFASIDGLKLHYVEAGSGDPVILLHGWPQHWWQWRHLIEPLSRDYRVICPDGRGQGWSEGRPGSYTLERQAQDLIDLMDALGIDRARIIGHDVGAFFGYQACFTHPERFEQFVAMAGVHPWTIDGVDPRLFLAPTHIYKISALGKRAVAPAVHRAWSKWRYAGQFTADEIATYESRTLSPLGTESTVQYFRQVLSHELPYFALKGRKLKLSVPTLHLNGAEDAITRGVSNSYTKYADDMRLELIPECGHFMAEERPDWVLDRVLRFFKESR